MRRRKQRQRYAYNCRYYRKRRREKDINPVFSIEAGKGDVTYTFEGNNISIENGKVKGLVANTETLVTAKTDNHEVVFKVKVTEKTIDRGTLTIADITVNDGATVDVNPVFSTEAERAKLHTRLTETTFP